ncbi:3-deoxy-8-phosphooctulonate synthase [Cesiribacter andamanensis]|uniref:2-dehydro-3-deoxyphosphooctonate aldolase n=1 Tax=Cesiribacter andamanensis AMV16 TaxID=1279009 RepID=M7MXL8_9BACT|nr:3-deoxy-8-phosphooctulonate synthase [Cesiribacter andamanensis]EMR01188.1 2-dehydro-3-deoxyphosphooctonate aldolase [Cesiribacter andamanensis AMV16]
MNVYTTPVTLAEGVKTGQDRLVLLSGPCAVESYDLCLEVATTVADICRRLDIGYVFKASFDKANRTSATSFRGVGMDRALHTLERIKKEVGVPVITDIHESHQVAEVAQVVDVLQIPAFLCRQTDLLLAAGASGRAVNVKKGQFMAPEDMKYAADKVRETGNANVLLCERGTTFGYHNLVVDMRALPIMRQYAPVIFDVTHSIQQPGGMGGSSGGQRQFASYLARAAAAAGVDGFFIETHPMPEKALSDGPNMIPLQQMEDFLKMLQGIWQLSKAAINS